MPQSKLTKALLKKLPGENERVGFVTKSGKLVEVENICDQPQEGFDVSGADIVKYSADAVATWHTHPNLNNNLSTNDFETFMNWPELAHYIVGTNGVRKYVVEDGEVLICSDK